MTPTFFHFNGETVSIVKLLLVSIIEVVLSACFNCTLLILLRAPRCFDLMVIRTINQAIIDRVLRPRV